jgi:hypothetical protein
MAEKRFLKPRHKGLKIRMPNTMFFLSEKGGSVPWTGPQGRYWRKRVRTGDCVLIENKTMQRNPIKKEDSK